MSSRMFEGQIVKLDIGSNQLCWSTKVCDAPATDACISSKRYTYVTGAF